jgi:hypothetical protein
VTVFAMRRDSVVLGFTPAEGSAIFPKFDILCLALTYLVVEGFGSGGSVAAPLSRLSLMAHSS